MIANAVSAAALQQVHELKTGRLISASVVCASTGISRAEVTGDKRSRAIVQARHLAMYLARELTDISLPQIGERFGGRDHTTVLHAVDKVGKLMHEDRDIYNLIQQLTTRIKMPR